MRVWRIQTSDGKGPLCGRVCGSFTPHDIPQMIAGSDEKEDLIDRRFNEGWVCSWNSAELMREFPFNSRTVADLQHHRFAVCVYEANADAIQLRDGQVIFNPEQSELIETIAPYTFFGEE